MYADLKAACFSIDGFLIFFSIAFEYLPLQAIATLIESKRNDSIAMNLNLLILQDRHQSEEKAMLNNYQSILDKHRNKSELTLAAEKDKSELEISTLKKDYEMRHNAVTDQYTFLLLNGVEKGYEVDDEVILF